MTRNDNRGPLPLFSRESYEIFKATYFFMAMCALCLIAFAVSATLGVERGVLMVPFAAATLCMACIFATFYIRRPEDLMVGHAHVAPLQPVRRIGGSMSVELAMRRSRGR
jgi:hypothetical protein